MSISFQCPKCQAAYKVKADFAGRTVKCKSCAHSIRIPAASSATDGLSPATLPAKQSQPSARIAGDANADRTAGISASNAGNQEAVSQEALLAAIQAPIAPVPTTLAYRTAALVVATLMVMLPLVYIGLIVLFGFGLVYFAIHGTSIFQMESGPSGRGRFLLVLMYVTPLVAGAVTILFMIKPLFARSAKAASKRSLRREDEPKLFAFVDRLCESVHAPKPKRIDVDCEVNASASFRRGMLSMFFSNDLVLTIGMPLVAGLNTRQLGGVLAHEFGHFSQGFGMRVSYVVRMVSYWFARVVYERDSWDEWLANTANSIDIRFGIVLHMARIVVWFTRRILWVLMMLGQVFSCYLLRQMEFDADLHEIRFSGSETFRKTSMQLRRLGIGYQQAMADQQHFFRNGKLGDDMPKLTQWNRDGQEESLVKMIFSGVMEEKTEWLATHPVDKDRVQRAKEEAEVGVFQLEVPASQLFANFDQVCQDVTQDFFQQAFAEGLKSNMLVPVEQLVSHKEAAKQAASSTKRFFGPNFDTPRVIEFASASDVADVDPQQLRQQLTTAREHMITLLPEYSRLTKTLSETDSRWLTCFQVMSLMDLDANLKESDFDGLPVRDRGRMKATAQELQNKLAKMNTKLQPMEQAFASRVQAAGALLSTPEIGSALQDTSQALVQEQHAILAALSAVQSSYGELIHLRNDFAAASLMLQAVAGKQVSDEIIQTVTSRVAKMTPQLANFHEKFKQQRFPFEHADGEITLTQYMIPKVPASTEIGEVLEAANTLLDNYHYVYFRSLGGLAAICQQVESAMGMEAQPEPEPEAETTSEAN